MDLYSGTFATLSLADTALATMQYLKHRTAKHENGVALLQTKENFYDSPVWRFQASFFAVYAFVVGADWIQGPYLYVLYKYEKAFSEQTVAALFATGFVSAGISASFVGSLADKHGRKLACLYFCTIYSVSCLAMISESFVVLFIGRLLGGLGTTLLYSIFETWMVHEYHARALHNEGLQLSCVFGRMTTLSGIVAIICGVLGEYLVDKTGTKVAPFIASSVFLAIAFLLIYCVWTENYGIRNASPDSGLNIVRHIKMILHDSRIISLGAISCLFEGSMYMFVFFWSAALKSARAAADRQDSPPFGLAFATFMSAMMLGSSIFTFTGEAMTIHISKKWLGFVLVAGGGSLLAAVVIRSELLLLWVFCVFEACVGLYYPCMGFLKEHIVQDIVRASTYGLMRMPLNVFVVVTLGLTKEGDDHRENVFLFCSFLVLVAYIVLQRTLHEDEEHHQKD